MIRVSACLNCKQQVQSGTRGLPALYCSRTCKKQHRLAAMTCEECGKQHYAANPKQKYCSPQCSNEARRIEPIYHCKWCSRPFFPKAKNRKTYCTRECAFADLKANAQPRVERCPAPTTCADCGQQIERPRTNKKYCERIECVKNRNKLRERSRFVGTPPRTFVCSQCDREFVRQGKKASGKRVTTYCSVRCAKKGSNQYRSVNGMKRKRRENEVRERRLIAATVERIRPRVVFKRDNWLCHVCGERCDPESVFPSPMYPTVDHVIPLARGGEHSYANVKCCCFSCNSRKRDLLIA